MVLTGTAEFTVRDASNKVTLNIADSTTKIIGTLTVSSSQTIHIPQFAGRRGWACIIGQNWSPTRYVSVGNVSVSGENLVITISTGVYTILYGVY